MVLVIVGIFSAAAIFFAICLVAVGARADRMFREAERRSLTLAELNAAWEQPDREGGSAKW